MGGNMPRELRYTDKALADLDALTSWLTEPGAGRAARRRLTAVWAAIERLREHPPATTAAHRRSSLCWRARLPDHANLHTHGAAAARMPGPS
jgi:plasmid stabilization system protein ParE